MHTLNYHVLNCTHSVLLSSYRLVILNSSLRPLSFFLRSSRRISFLVLVVPYFQLVLSNSSNKGPLFLLFFLWCAQPNCTENHYLRNNIRFLWPQTFLLFPWLPRVICGISKCGWKYLSCERSWIRKVARWLFLGARLIRIVSGIQALDPMNPAGLLLFPFSALRLLLLAVVTASASWM